MPTSQHTIVSYLRSKKKKKTPTQPTVNIMATTTTPGMNAAAAPALKSEVNEDFRPKFNDIKELIKNSPDLALSCMPFEKLKKDDPAMDSATNRAAAAGGKQGVSPDAAAVANSMRGAFGKEEPGAPKTPTPPNDDTPDEPAPVVGAYNKAAMKPAGAAKMPKGPAGMAPKAPATPTPTAPKAPSAQMAPKKPKGMAGPTMAKGDVVAMASGRVIATDDKNNKNTNPSEMKHRIANQHKASQYTPMKPAPVRADGTRIHKEEMDKGSKIPYNQHDKGVQPNTNLKGVSNAGLEVRYGDKSAAIKEHKDTLKEMAKMPKPKLGKEEKGKEIKRPDGPQVSAGGGKNFPVKEHKESGKEGLNIVTPPNGTKKGEACAYKPSKMIKEELAQKWEPKFHKGDDDFEPGVESTLVTGSN